MKYSRSLLWILAMVTLVVGGCVVMPPATPIPPETRVPESIPDILLPDEIKDRALDIVSSQGLDPDEGLAVEHTVIYALPDDSLVASAGEATAANAMTGIVYMLTPQKNAPWGDKPPAELKEIPNQVLGVLAVVQQLIEELPEDVYVIISDPEGSIQFIGEKYTASFEGSVSTLRDPIASGRPVALITSRHMCLTWGKTQICAKIPTPLPEKWQQVLKDASAKVKVELDWLDLDGAVPDVEGLNGLKRCEDALKQDPPAYSRCTATVLAAPIDNESDVPIPTLGPDVGTTVSATTVIEILEPIEDFICQDVQCDDQVVARIESGAYLMYDIVLDDDDIVWEDVTNSRTGMSTAAGSEPDFYLPAVIGFTGLTETGLSQEVISNLWKCKRNGKCSCYFKKWQCPWLF